MLSAPKLNAFLVRWAVEVRQKQLAQAKSRVVPQSVRDPQRERDADENIQFKRPHRA